MASKKTSRFVRVAFVLASKVLEKLYPSTAVFSLSDSRSNF